MEYEELDPEEKEPEPIPPQLVEEPEPEPEEEEPEEIEATPQEMRSVLKAWERKAKLALKKTGSAEVEFVTKIIPIERQATIRAALAAAKTPEEIREAMDAPISIHAGEVLEVDGELKALVDQLSRLWAETKAEPPAISPNVNVSFPAINVYNQMPAPEVTVTPAPLIQLEPPQVDVIVNPTPVNVQVDAPVTVQPATVEVRAPQSVTINRNASGDISSLEAK
jgi:hypothetical protein